MDGATFRRGALPSKRSGVWILYFVGRVFAHLGHRDSYKYIGTWLLLRVPDRCRRALSRYIILTMLTWDND